MAKTVAGEIKLQVSAGSANPSPPVGPAFGQRGLNIMEFCKQFNDKTKNFDKGTPIPVVVTAYSDKTFDFITKTPPVSYMILQKAGLKKGSQTPGKDVAGSIEFKKVKEIAEMKQEEMCVDSIDSAISMIKGTAVSMGVEVVE